MQSKQFEQQNHFYEIFKIERIEGSKIVLFIKNPGIYKVIFDNKYSWMTSKLIRYRVTTLKEKVNDDNINNENNINQNENNNIDTNNNKDNENLEEDTKIDVL